MYQGTLAQTGGVLATTGALTAYYAVGAWTLVVAGLALVTTVRVLAHRRATR
ncbi:hypothetical protein ACFWH7_19655 [Cellulosimicrobium cellulans]|uniref:hypothetical protein n=1 Tax=Cellulosimicrobium cellulans TaxID=1710 RepID=UPI00364FE6E6